MAGHVGDGNFHASVLTSNEKELAIAKEAVTRMVHRAIALDGTCKSRLNQPISGLTLFRHRYSTQSEYFRSEDLLGNIGEHGVGLGKRDHLVSELGSGTVELMKTVKAAIDPLNLFNPGKVGIYAMYTSCSNLTPHSYIRTIQRAGSMIHKTLGVFNQIFPMVTLLVVLWKKP